MGESLDQTATAGSLFEIGGKPSQKFAKKESLTRESAGEKGRDNSSPRQRGWGFSTHLI